jgi:1-acyl-sn-glycerol-3-phosphate acyltransferase
VQQRVAGSPALHRYRAGARAALHALGRVEVSGVELIPEQGPVLLAANHRSLVDGPLLVGFTPRPVSCLVKAEAFRPGLAALLRGSGQIPVVRGTVDPGPVRLCLSILRAGGVVGIFPEGTRGTGLAATAKPGVGWLALRSGASVLPVACHGTAELARRRTALRPVARMVVGRPIAFDRWPDARPLNRKLSADAAEQVRLALAGLVRETA